MIKTSLALLKQRIKATAVRAGRDPDEIELVLVTKNVDIPRIKEAYETGERKFGENRVQDLIEKREQLPPDVEWHLIGHLQTNKVKSVIGKVHLIHSLDSLRLARTLEEKASVEGSTIQVLIQVNVTGEETKFGIPPREFLDLLENVALFRHLKPIGLMTIGPLEGNEESIRSAFRSLAMLRRDGVQKGWMGLKYLSMGMTHDFEIAIEEGANLIRIGTAVFGERSRTDAAA